MPDTAILPERGIDMPNWFDARKILKEKPDARYYFVLGGRARGKTFAVLDVAEEDNTKGEGLFAYIRRFDEEIKDKNIRELFSPQGENIEKYTEGKYNKITHFRGFFYFEKWGEDPKTGKYTRLEKNPAPCGVALALNTWERAKGQDIGAAYGGFKHIILDEAITGLSYLSDEFQKLKNVISSLVRTRQQDTKIWMLANPLSMWCPYFAELGITKEMIKPSDEDKFYEIKYNGTDMTTIFIYLGTAPAADDTQDTIYQSFFAFPNSSAKSKSITGGFWELQDSEHLPSQVYKNSTLKKEVFLYFSENWIRGQIMRYDANGTYYLVWSPSRPPKKNEYYFILNAVPDRYAIVGTRTGHPMAKLLNDIIQTGQIYYSDNTTADIYHGFIKEANKIVR